MGWWIQFALCICRFPTVDWKYCLDPLLAESKMWNLGIWRAGCIFIEKKAMYNWTSTVQTHCWWSTLCIYVSIYTVFFSFLTDVLLFSNLEYNVKSNFLETNIKSQFCLLENAYFFSPQTTFIYILIFKCLILSKLQGSRAKNSKVRQKRPVTFLFSPLIPDSYRFQLLLLSLIQVAGRIPSLSL